MSVPPFRLVRAVLLPKLFRNDAIPMFARYRKSNFGTPNQKDIYVATCIGTVCVNRMIYIIQKSSHIRS